MSFDAGEQVNTQAEPLQNSYNAQDLELENLWSGVLRDTWPLEGQFNQTGAIRIMQAITKGTNYILSIARGRNFLPESFQHPNYLGSKTYKANTLIAYDPSRNAFILNLEELAKRSLVPTDDIITAKDQDGKVQFVGQINDYSFLGGVEEMVHAIEYQRGEIIDERKLSEKTRQEEYDAQEHEFRALKWQIFAAQHNDIPKKTIDILKERLRNARKHKSEIRDEVVDFL